MTDRQCIAQLLLLAAIVLMALVSSCHSYPSAHPFRNENFMRRRSLQDCERSARLRMTCERCAKESRSDDAFIMCCSDTDGIREWCEKFLAFGSDDSFITSKRFAV
ncbi:uncharacterized protein LOC122373959 [Amphibalanus amphitrite]|uniref:uncharacterized protein LOC122373959 n=1 Tax=Amphibalanus amphitrite TaxID=1232801 RepID=UPI001C916643|nr:uncharacterized protein LOC122373959 [Amphibalanus amphitrite]